MKSLPEEVRLGNMAPPGITLSDRMNSTDLTQQ